MENTANESVNIILEKADQVATDTLELLATQLKDLGITEQEMIDALQFAIATKMYEKASAKVKK